VNRRGPQDAANARVTFDLPQVLRPCLILPARQATNLELSGGYSAAALDLLDDRDDLGVQGVVLLQTVDLGDDILGGVLLEDLGQLG